MPGGIADVDFDRRRQLNTTACVRNDLAYLLFPLWALARVATICLGEFVKHDWADGCPHGRAVGPGSPDLRHQRPPRLGPITFLQCPQPQMAEFQKNLLRLATIVQQQRPEDSAAVRTRHALGESERNAQEMSVRVFVPDERERKESQMTLLFLTPRGVRLMTADPGRNLGVA